jgi:uncharacterized protein YfaS (alpha-2-macroglobulin family)
MKQISILFSVLLCCYLTACNTNTQEGSSNEGINGSPPIIYKSNEKYKHHVRSYTAGIISKTAPIRVRFAVDIVPQEIIGKQVADQILSFSPAIEGEAIWEDRKTIKFIPKEWLPAGKTYEATANLRKIYPDITDELATLSFPFQTLQQDFEVEIDGLRESSLIDYSTMRLIGNIKTIDAADSKAVEAMLQLAMKGTTNFKVDWTHKKGNKVHQFTIKKIPRATDETTLGLTLDGQGIGISKIIKEEVTIPNQIFKILSVNAKGGTDSDPYISVRFSIPLQQLQPIDGLVQIQGYDDTDYYGNSNYKYLIDGNELQIYPTRGVEGKRTISISAGIRSINQTAIAKPSTWDVSFYTTKPGVRMINSGTIVPQTKGLYLPFEAAKLNGVTVEIFKIYEDNVLQFLQQNDMNEEYDYALRHVGRIVAQQHISLASIQKTETNPFGWKRYTLPLDQFIKEEPGAIYQVRLGFSKEDALCECLEQSSLQSVLPKFEKDDEGEFESIYNGDYYYDYENRDNPCKDGYYTSRHFVKKNILGSNIGIIAKRGKDKKLFISTTDLLKGAPSPNVEIEVYDHVQHLLAKKKTDNNGVLQLSTAYEPRFIVATNGKQKGYLRMKYGDALSLSNFSTSGSSDAKGLKGKIYGERGVWRPGDSLHLNFVLEDKRQVIPSNHPVHFTLTDPNGNLFYETTISKNVHGIYDFSCQTDPSSPTGYWSAKVVVGGSNFYEDIQIETIKPNRMKMEVDFGKDQLLSTDKNLKGKIKVDWLHGAPAADVRTVINLRLAPTPTQFDGLEEYVFDDPARNGFDGEPYTIVDKQTDAKGEVNIEASIASSIQPPGFLRAFFSLSATEASGDASTDNFKLPFSPYPSYVGIKTTTADNENSLEINVDNEVLFVVVDETGKPIANRTISVGAYRLKSNWWWDRDAASEVTNFNSSTHVGAVSKAIITTNDKGEATWKFKPTERGRYLLRAYDKVSQHSTGMRFYAGNIWQNDAFDQKTSASNLAFATTKQSYEVGETVELNIPGGKTGHALLTLEDGFGVLDYQWVEMKNQDGIQKITFEATKAMSPTVYAHVTLIQPHQEVEEGLPIRSYGVIPVKIVDPKSKLEPVLDMADVLSPNTNTAITVSEANSQPMAYTIAIVDEGLLGLTRFRTPTLWNHFYKKEALGVRTWDMFSDVMGKFELNQILAVGGGGMGAQDGQKANRFKPVVQHLGPFYLAAGKKATHNIVLPNYIGAVRTMVVAAHEGAYGKADKTTPVRDPLMVLGTLPRVLSPGEKLKLPVTIFAMEDQIKAVKIDVTTNDKLTIKGNTSQTIPFDKIGEKVAFFDLEVPKKIGIATVQIKATSGKETATYSIELDVRNPNPYQSKTYAKVLQTGEKWSTSVVPVGMTGTNTAALELSSLPPINLSKRLNYLIRYPYGCIEQTTSAVFPQLVLNNLIPLDKKQTAEVETNIRAAITRLQQFQTGTGGFAYWAGDYETSEWGTNYAGHFLIEAKAQGYPVPSSLLKNWIKYQKSQAKNWTARPVATTGTTPYYRSKSDQEALVQAYRLYVLALAGAPDIGAMNRLRNDYNFSTAAKWKLAASYALIGQKSVAMSIIKGLDITVSPYQEISYTYGSALRDEAMILETLIQLKEYTSAAKLLQKMAKELNADQWHSTQTLAYSLVAISKFAGGQKASSTVPLAYQIGSSSKKSIALSKTPMTQIPFNVEKKTEQKIWVENKAKKPLFVTVALSGKPLTGDTSSSASNLKINIVYKDFDDKVIDPTRLEQGTSFKAVVSITNTGLRGRYDEMALQQVFPAGWEISNTRMGGAFESATGDSPLDYQNIRDDRVYTHFDIPQGKTYTYDFYLTAAYQGTFYMPNVSCGAMYDNTVYAQTAGRWVQVVPRVTTAQ